MSSPTESSRLLAPPDQAASSRRHGNGTTRSNRITYPALFEHPDVKSKSDQGGGPFPSFNPTQARFDFPSHRPDGIPGSSSRNDDQRTSEVLLEGRARDTRKERHPFVISPHHFHFSRDSLQLSRNLTSMLRGIWRMLTVFAYWDVSWWIGVFFSIGCQLFILTGVFKVASLGIDDGKKELVGGIAACIGATLFAFAGVLLVIEATNEDQTGRFGWAIDQTYDETLTGSSSYGNDGDGDERAKPPSKRRSRSESASLRVQHLDCQHLHQQHPHASRTWRWWPTWHELTAHYFHNLGYLGSIVLAIGTIVFWVSGILSLPPLSERLSLAAMKWTYWLAFLVGGFHFAAASILYILQSQRKWYRPSIRSLSWWIGFFDLVGSVGWILSAALGGYCGRHWCTWQSDVALLWASVAFETGSLLLWYKAVEKYPVESTQ